MPSLSEKVAIVTGASSGFGAAASRLLAAEGCRVVLGARRMDRLETLAAQIQESGGAAVSQQVDVREPAQIDALVGRAIEEFGRVDILFNNAGFGRLDWLERLDPVEDIRAQVTVDLLGMMWTARAVLPHMYLQRSGTIINMCSMAGWAAPPLYAAYSAAKFGVRGFSEALRREAMNFGVRVCVVYPSGASTEFASHIGSSKAKKRFSTPKRLTLSAEQVARTVVALAKRPRRQVFLPWWMGISAFLNSHLGGISDQVQSRLFRPYHEL